jgi:hypothetical protein
VERLIKYQRHEFRYPTEPREAPLWAFFFDVPYLLVFGVFPPRRVLNSHLRSGGGDGGMSPGASWQPFELTEDGYNSVLPLVLKPDHARLRTLVRYPLDEVTLDPEFDGCKDLPGWLGALRGKYDLKQHR